MDNVEGPKVEKPGRQLPWPRIVGFALVLAAIVWFAVDNSQTVTIDWWVVERESRLIYVILVSLGLGVLLDRLVQRRRRKSKKEAA